jgi:hypothetical protein
MITSRDCALGLDKEVRRALSHVIDFSGHEPLNA